MSKLMAYRNACLADLKAAFRDVNTVDVHPGKMNDDEIRKLLTRTPALYLAMLGITGTQPLAASGCVATTKFAVFIITGDKPRGETREVIATTLAERLLAFLDRYQPRDEDGNFLSRPLTGARFDNLFATSSSSSGQMLSAVSWDVMITLQGAALPDSLTDEPHGLTEASVVMGGAP